MKTADLTTKDSDIEVVFGKHTLKKRPREEAFGSLKYLYTDLTDIRKYYIHLGFHLSEFKSCEYYKDFGYLTLEDFCDVNLAMDKGAVSRCINVYRQFNASSDIKCIAGTRSVGCAMDLSDRWKDYSYTQLCEMLSLSEKERENVCPDMTVKQIREYKKILRNQKKTVAATQSETPEEEPVAVTQPERFNYDEMLSKNGIVRQNYIKSRDRVGDHGLSVLLYDSRGKEVIVNYTAEILEQSPYRLVLRMFDSFDLDCKQPDQKEEKMQH